MISDETAYRRYLDGEEKAADLLVEKYGDALTLYINGYVRDIQEAEDLMIEAFSRIFAKERPITGEGAFQAYLYKTARNLALRHRKKHRLSFLRLEELEFEPRSDVPADRELYRDERSRQLCAALEKLKAEYREALYLVYFEDMSYRSAAAVMNQSEGQITKLVYRGKQNLKAILEQEGFTYADE
ncbi:RNA polymerase sigma factor [Dysosmobacter sp.]|uniref:RNA polymerase sigma factor n=1 Tax=Dysosmobacter sp. TaxID=2591382 RepID=UPI002A8780CE|nr:sigma-70 family RNA polymerase sigma factor [Dysosmobacter sp.]MDY3282300.1 sigma-70 family RNA polymerase sigma factor [Dysosmobacter sp.]